MEKTPWRTIFVGTGSSILLFLFIYLFLAPGDRDFYEKSLPDKPVKFEQIKISGRTEGHPSWYFEAESGYSNKNQELTILADVTSGEIYKNDQPVLKDLHMKEAKVYRSSKEFEGFKHSNGAPSTESGYLTATLNLAQLTPSKEGTKKQKPDYYSINADYLKYSENRKTTLIKGSVNVSGKKYKILSGIMEIDHDKEISRFSDNVRLYRKNLFLNCSTLEYLSKDEKIISTGKLTFILTQKKRKTNAMAESLTAFNDDKKDMLLGGPIYLSQTKKTVSADNATINESNKILELKGHVKAIFDKGQNILSPDTLKQIDSSETKDFLKNKTNLTADRLVIFTDTENSQVYGNVVITQKNKEARSDFASYDEKNDQIIMTGNVEIKKENGWVKCKKVFVSIKDESLTAQGEVRSEFMLKK
jgi:lipopolysaccharide assembly outer membrane protein LptD (OstA)